MGKVLNYMTMRAGTAGYVEEVSFPMIAKFAGIGLRSVPRIIEALQAEGKIKIARARGRGLINRYYITTQAES